MPDNTNDKQAMKDWLKNEAPPEVLLKLARFDKAQKKAIEYMDFVIDEIQKNGGNADEPTALFIQHIGGQDNFDTAQAIAGNIAGLYARITQPHKHSPLGKTHVMSEMQQAVMLTVFTGILLKELLDSDEEVRAFKELDKDTQIKVLEAQRKSNE